MSSSISNSSSSSATTALIDFFAFCSIAESFFGAAFFAVAFSACLVETTFLVEADFALAFFVVGFTGVAFFVEALGWTAFFTAPFASDFPAAFFALATGFATGFFAGAALLTAFPFSVFFPTVATDFFPTDLAGLAVDLAAATEDPFSLFPITRARVKCLLNRAAQKCVVQVYRDSVTAEQLGKPLTGSTYSRGCLHQILTWQPEHF